LIQPKLISSMLLEAFLLKKILVWQQQLSRTSQYTTRRSPIEEPRNFTNLTGWNRFNASLIHSAQSK